ncbi:MAG TPA: Dabb family protein [archaeon]|nr:Dabb family protein [archaeon]
MLRKSLLCLAAAAVFCGGCVISKPDKNLQEKNAQPEKPAIVLRHVVLFKFKEDTTPDQIKKIESEFCALPGKIKAIYDFEWGTDVSVENLSQGFTHCFVVTFRDQAGRDEYLPHPAHKEFGAFLQPYLEKVLVVDYWTKS